MSGGIVIVFGALLIVVGIYALFEGVGERGRVESRFMDVSGPGGLVIIGIGAIMIIIGASM